MPTLTDAVAIVTGASSGIGEATARSLADAGATVVLAARRIDRLHALKSDIEDAGGRALVVETDVTDRAAVQRLADRTVETFGRIDILVNNAGVMPLSLVENLHVDEWLTMVDVNINGVLHGVAAVLPTMLEQGSGHIVNVSSDAARKQFRGGAVYCATKSAVSSFSEGLRQELTPSHGIRVTAIEPGAVTTELAQSITDQDILDGGDAWSFKLLDAEDVAAAIRYAVEAPEHVDVCGVLVRPAGQHA